MDTMLTERRIRSPRPYSVFQASELQLKQLLLAGGTGISEYTGAGSRGGSRLYWHGRRIHCRIICSGGTPGQGIGHQLISEVKRKKRLSLHVYEKNTGAVAFYRAEGFRIENSMTEKETGEQEYLMVFHEDGE